MLMLTVWNMNSYWVSPPAYRWLETSSGIARPMPAPPGGGRHGAVDEVRQQDRSIAPRNAIRTGSPTIARQVFVSRRGLPRSRPSTVPGSRPGGGADDGHRSRHAGPADRLSGSRRRRGHRHPRRPASGACSRPRPGYRPAVTDHRRTGPAQPPPPAAGCPARTGPQRVVAVGAALGLGTPLAWPPPAAGTVPADAVWCPASRRRPRPASSTSPRILPYPVTRRRHTAAALLLQRDPVVLGADPRTADRDPGTASRTFSCICAVGGCKQCCHRLTNAFKEKNQAKILKLSAEIGHYIADAHVPLHASSNHNGQFTDQKGIHGFWESRIPELLADKEWDFFIGKAEYIQESR